MDQLARCSETLHAIQGREDGRAYALAATATIEKVFDRCEKWKSARVRFFANLLDKPKCVKLSEMPTAIANDLHRHVGKDRLSKRADRTAIRSIAHELPCRCLGSRDDFEGGRLQVTA